MAGSKTNYLENKILDGVLGGPAFSLPSSVWVCLSTAVYSETATGSSMSEVSGGSYARVEVTNNDTNFPAAASGSKSNGTAVQFPTATGSWGTVRSFYIVDASSGGNCLYGGDLTTQRSVISGDTVSFAAGSIVVTED